MLKASQKNKTSKLKLDKIEKHTRSIPGGGYIFSKPSKPSKGKQEEDYSKYIK